MTGLRGHEMVDASRCSLLDIGFRTLYCAEMENQTPLHLSMKNLLRSLHILSTLYLPFPCSFTLKTPLFVFDITKDPNSYFQVGITWQ